MLVDLSSLRDLTKKNVIANLQDEIEFDIKTKEKIFSLYNQNFPKFNAKLLEHSIRIDNDKKQTAYLPFNWFARIRRCQDLIPALNNYATIVDDLKPKLKDETLRQLPCIEWETKIEASEVSIINRYLNQNLIEQNNIDLFKSFLDGRSWLEVKENDSEQLQGKKLNRGKYDYIASCITNICFLINDTAGKLEQFIRLYIESEELRDQLSNLNSVYLNTFKNLNDSSPEQLKEYGVNNNPKAANLIFCGAPGTGKSYEIHNKSKDGICYKTVFHPDSQYTDFVGSLKPYMFEENNESKIGYQFRPGPFTQALIEAVNSHNEHIYLVIEEINRASAAAVFGELFQLLDRKEDGSSEYSINISDPDMLQYIKNSLVESKQDFFIDNKIFLPSNLSIYATMNSSDQAVMPLDTAFKRRWQFIYQDIDYSKATKGLIYVSFSDGIERNVPWSIFAKGINSILLDQGVPEDRLLGHRYLSDSELKDKNSSGAAIGGKLLMYLWDDVLRHGKRNCIFTESIDGVNISSFGQLTKAFQTQKAIFTESLENCLLYNLNTELDSPVNELVK